MGCISSKSTVVQPLTPEEVNGDEADRGSKLRGCGDSAMSKGTTDSGVVMEKEISMLPGAVPRKLPPLTSEWIRESETPARFLQHESTALERQKSSEILEELLNEGIISVGQKQERSSGAGEAYSIMLNDRESVRRRPPARLESLKKTQNLPSREDIAEKIRLAEERRKVREDELRMRLRAKSARVRIRAPISTTEEDEEASITTVEPLESPPSPDFLQSQLQSQNAGETAEGEDHVREVVVTEGQKEMGPPDEREERQEGGVSEENREGDAERVSEDEEEEQEWSQVTELPVGELLSALVELESDSGFQHQEGKEESF